MPTLTPTAAVIVDVLSLIVGGGGGGFLVAFLKFRRDRPADQANAERARLEVTQVIETLSANALKGATAELAEVNRRHLDAVTELQRQHADKLARIEHAHQVAVEALMNQHRSELALAEERHGAELGGLRAQFAGRVAHLETIMRARGIEVTPWSPGTVHVAPSDHA